MATKPPHTQAEGQTGRELGVRRRIRPPHSLRLRGRRRPSDHPLARRRHPQGSLLKSHPAFFSFLSSSASHLPVIGSHAVAWQSSRHFGIPNYDTDWIAASTLSGLPRDDTFSITVIAGSSPTRQSMHPSPVLAESSETQHIHAPSPCHCEPRSGVAIQTTLLHHGLRCRLVRRVDPFGPSLR